MAQCFLPADIVTGILSRLPAKSLVRFRCVCRQWNSFSHDPYFVERHGEHRTADRAPSKILFFCQKNHNKEVRLHDFDATATRIACTSSYEITYKSSSDGSFVDGRQLELPLPELRGRKRKASHRATWSSDTNELLVSNLVDGLICAYDPDERDRVYLLNPFTRDRELVKLPTSNQNNDLVSYGFGCSVDSNIVSYKLIRISRDRRTGDQQGEILTLGTHKWRYLGKVPDRVIVTTRPVYARGILYWGYTSSRNIVTFGVDDEKFGIISTLSFYLSKPYFQNSKHYFQGYLHLCGWRGNLYVVVGCISIPYMIIMVREDRADGGEWTKLCDVDASSFLGSSSGYYVRMIGIEDEKIMLVTCDYTASPRVLVLCYDPCRRTLSKLHDDRIDDCRNFDLSGETLRSPKVVLIGNGDV